jgi:hypothetical protein
MTVLQAAGREPYQALGRWLGGRSARTAALWLGLLLVLVFSSLATDRAGPAPTERNWVFGRLNRERSFGQTFVAPPGELVAVRVLLFADPHGRDDPVTLRLRYADGDLPDLALATLPLRRVGRSDWTTFEIPSLTLSLTAALRLDLAVPTLPATDWVTVMAGRDTYPDGTLLVDGRLRPMADLAFQPVYRHRWLDGLLPITRMAQGKPGALGWPPLYALLVYGCGVAVVRLILGLWHGMWRG